MTLFTSDRTGFSRPSAVTIATGLVSPVSIGLLYIHRRVFDTVGARKSILATSFTYASIILIATLVLQTSPTRTLSQATVLSLFVLKNSFVHLLMTQHWSFLTSLLQSNTASWTPILAGMGSITSTLAGWAVTPALQMLSSTVSSSKSRSNFGMIGLLVIASVGVLSTAVLSDAAYSIAERVCKHQVNCSDILFTLTRSSTITTEPFASLPEGGCIDKGWRSIHDTRTIDSEGTEPLSTRPDFGRTVLRR